MLISEYGISFSVDLWSVGCIFAELLGRKILFQAQSPIQQLNQTIDLLGTPHPNDIRAAGASEGAFKYIMSRAFKPQAMHRLYNLSSLATHEAVHLLCRMLVFNPDMRITATDALSHPYLDEGRLRYHTCMCTCCSNTSNGRQYCGGMHFWYYLQCICFVVLFLHFFGIILFQSSVKTMGKEMRTFFSN